MEFTGGTEIQILTAHNPAEIVKNIQNCAKHIEVSQQQLDEKTSLVIKTREDITDNCIQNALLNSGFTKQEAKAVVPSRFKPELGKTLMQQGVKVMFIAFALMSIIVFLAFRTFIPSVAVILAAVFDIWIAIGLIGLSGIKLTLASIAALMMLIGYSVDSDIMLTSRILKHGGKTFPQLVNDAFTTGITMSLTTIGAMFAIVIATSIMRMDALFHIAVVIVFGLLADLLTTWFMNVNILQWYVNSKYARKRVFKIGIFRG
jgi:preprotein translocase subunit SecF